MSEIKGDPVIKLFGRTIPLPPLLTATGDASVSGSGGVGGDDGREEEKDTRKKSSELPSSPGHKSSKPPPDQEKTLKKPEKILPCPRCKSIDTKFCYFNNYNLNQPRHFCKNCQRYWTAGGTTRNVPVGAGRRKHKSHRHITILADKPIDESAPSSSSDATKATMQCPRIRAPRCPYPWSTSPNPVLFAPSFPMAFFPSTAYWGTDPSWLSPVAPSPTSGKNSRERDDDDKQERCLWAPKTLRIDNPGDAAKSSIWAMLGDKKKAFQTKAGSEGWRAAPEASGVFQANPAALSRSLNFQESS